MNIAKKASEVAAYVASISGYCAGYAAEQAEMWLMSLPRPLKRVSQDQLNALARNYLWHAGVTTYQVSSGKLARVGLVNRQFNRTGVALNITALVIIVPIGAMVAHELFVRSRGANDTLDELLKKHFTSSFKG